MNNSLVFDYLNSCNSDYVVFDHEIINNNSFYKIYISPAFFDKNISDLIEHGLNISELEDYCLYGMKKVLFVSIDDNVYYFFSRPAIRSLDYSWVPFNSIVENDFRTKRVLRNNIFILSPEDTFFYLICKNVFNHQRDGFDEQDILRIIDCKEHFSVIDDHLKELFESVFYKFCPALFNLIEINDYDGIFNKYLSFAEY